LREMVGPLIGNGLGVRIHWRGAMPGLLDDAPSCTVPHPDQTRSR
jgi:hypothetical protein